MAVNVETNPAIRTITVAHSPDSDDAFMFYGLATNKLETDGLKFEHTLKDIQSLNEDAKNGVFDVTAISFTGSVGRPTISAIGRAMSIAFSAGTRGARKTLMPPTMKGAAIRGRTRKRTSAMPLGYPASSRFTPEVSR